MGKVKYFDTVEQAVEFVNENKIKFYHMETPTFLERGVDLVIEETFICEICGEETPISCEGSEPHTCAMCMPLPETDFVE